MYFGATTLNTLRHCFSNIFARGPFLTSKINHGSSHLFSRKYIECPGEKFKIYISDPILDTYEYIPVTYVLIHCTIRP